MAEENWVAISPLSVPISITSPKSIVVAVTSLNEVKSPETPDEPMSPCRSINISSTVQRIKEINLIENYFEIEIKLFFAWNLLSIDDAWEPRLDETFCFLDILNKIQIKSIDNTKNTVSTSTVNTTNGDIKEMSVRFSVKAKCDELDIRAFPFDKHELTLTVQFPVISTDDTTQIMIDSNLMQYEATRISGWRVLAATQSLISIPSEHLLTITVTAQRVSDIYLTHVLLPKGLLTTVVFGCFLIDSDELEDRLNLVLLLLVALSIGQLSAVSLLPRVTYCTTLDTLSTSCFVLVVIVGLESMLVSRLDNEAALGCDLFTGLALVLALLGMLGYVVLRAMNNV